MPYQEIKVSAYATSDRPKDATASVWIPELSKYYGHRVEVWTQNNGGRIKGQGLDRLPDGRVSRVWVDITAPGRTLFGPRNWIGVYLYVTVETTAKGAELKSLERHFDALGWITTKRPAKRSKRVTRLKKRRRSTTSKKRSTGSRQRR